jgi:hypothetical protein
MKLRHRDFSSRNHQEPVRILRNDLKPKAAFEEIQKLLVPLGNFQHEWNSSFDRRQTLFSAFDGDAPKSLLNPGKARGELADMPRPISFVRLDARIGLAPSG